jgi:hypothetical protein
MKRLDEIEAQEELEDFMYLENLYNDKDEDYDEFKQLEFDFDAEDEDESDN